MRNYIPMEGSKYQLHQNLGYLYQLIIDRKSLFAIFGCFRYCKITLRGPLNNMPNVFSKDNSSNYILLLTYCTNIHQICHTQRWKHLMQRSKQNLYKSLHQIDEYLQQTNFKNTVTVAKREIDTHHFPQCFQLYTNVIFQLPLNRYFSTFLARCLLVNWQSLLIIIPTLILTISHLQKYFDTFTLDNFWKHCGKRLNYS